MPLEAAEFSYEIWKISICNNVTFVYLKGASGQIRIVSIWYGWVGLD
jgi:hypothetical protein